MPALATITSLAVPATAAAHRFVDDALALAKVKSDKAERVIGTTNDKGPVVELYGWAEMVAPHVDNTGIIYFMPLRRTDSIVFAGDEHVLLEPGNVYRLDDYVPHGTYDDQPVVAMFCGPFPIGAGDDEHDMAAVARLGVGIAALARGTYDAPRVRPSLRLPLHHDECWAHDHASGCNNVMLLESAQHRRLEIARCSCCSSLAFRLDKVFPWRQEHNRCLRCLTASAASEAA